ncbi:Ribonucleoside-diphosphate reductase [Enterospora canceri]|uniref:Ribonucleoside-diphosphate reductase n=1 Tax=Enterospora canceri TaxID=1081671 RepID=A0A1Y1SA67_9MICR|nr:Ribonucleoside-diphosphate reductase [Enterospora canceri]
MNGAFRNSVYCKELCSYTEEFGLKYVDLELYFTKIENGLAQEMTEDELVVFCSEVAASMITMHTDYNKLASVIMIRNHHKNTSGSFSEKFLRLQKANGNFQDKMVEIVTRLKDKIDSIVDYSRDYNFDYFGFLSLRKTYLMKIDNKIVESPQDVYMRLSLQIHQDDLDGIKETYMLLAQQYYTHATPSLYNSCCKLNQMASCFLLAIKDDSVEGIFETILEAATIRKVSGGLGINMTTLRCNHSKLKTTGGESKGIIPIIKLISDSVKYLNKNEAKRSSACAFYLEPWHKDVFDFLDIRKNTGNEENRARDSFTALWINDIFMRRVESGANWSLFDPKEAIGLVDAYGDDFTKLYEHYETVLEHRSIPAQTLWREIICAQIETGTPYMLYKDACNRNSNQNNLGTIKCSNLCGEILEYSDSSTTAVCNLASICLPKFVKESPSGTRFFDFHLLHRVARIVARNLNSLIDTSHYPTETTRKSNMETRPLGIGIQGLADTFFMMKYPYESEDASKLNRVIFETIYHAAIEVSCDLSLFSGPYPAFSGSFYSQGVFHFEKYKPAGVELSGLWNWDELRKGVIQFGLRNSLFTACMPTATTAQICGNSECMEPIQSNIFTRRTFAGDFQVVNRFLMDDLIRLGLWSNEMRQLIIEYDGSIQSIPVIPDQIKQLYKTVWEIKMKRVLEMADDRQAFLDQTQSLNLFVKQPTYGILSSMHFYGWKLGLKTGMYYLRTCPVASAIKFTVDKELITKAISSMKEEEECEDCTC